MIETIFWLSMITLIYAFIGYPIMLKCIVLFRKSQSCTKENFTPSVSIILSVYNEEHVISEKIKNFLSLDYSRELIEMVIISDACTDKTEETIESFNCNRIKLLVQEKRCGKTVAINRGVTVANGDIVLFTDANSMFDNDAIKKLVEHFAVSNIGLVSGRSIYLDSNNNKEELGGIYRMYEEKLKKDESSLHSIVGADGAIYAMRRNLYEPLRPEFINDFVHTIQVVLKGYRAITEPGAICREIIDETHKDELQRQTRIMSQSWLIYISNIGKLIKKGKLLYAWEFTSHKFLRWLTLPLMFLCLVSTVSLLQEGTFFQMILLFQLIFISLVAFGRKLKGGIVRFPYYFILIHFASLLGLYKLSVGKA
ncbi:MAG: glycosyltransferase family 2 protein, partial [Thermodesulfobacteriota bacterium]